jgi:putative MATE family efflux protein
MVVSLVDTSLVGRLEGAKYALAAMGIGVLATWAMVSFFSSLSTGTHVLIARNFGAKDYDKCGKILDSSLVTSFFIGIIVSGIIISNAYFISNLLAVDNTVGRYAGQYLTYRFMGMPFFLLTVAYRGFYFGIGKTKVFMYSAIIVNLLNIVFSYVFIYGEFGFPRMELAGAGLGATLATACDSIFFFLVSLLPSYRKKFRYFSRLNKGKLDTKIIYSIIKISLPVSFQNVFILIGFLSFVAITGLIGTTEQAATQVVISTLFISLMPFFGFGIAAQTLVGNSIGSFNSLRAKIFGFETSRIATYYAIIIGIIFISFPRLMLNVLTTDKKVIETAVVALRIAGISQVFYATGIVLANGLQAAGKTVYVMISEVVTNWIIFVPLSYFLGVHLHLGLVGAWGALPFYIITYSALIYFDFRFGNWYKNKIL